MGCSSSVQAQDPTANQEKPVHNIPEQRPAPPQKTKPLSPDAEVTNVDENNNETEEKVQQDTDLPKTTLKEFRSLNKNIQALESRNVEERLQFLQLQLVDLEKACQVAKETTELMKAKEAEYTELAQFEISDLLKGDDLEEVNEDKKKEQVEYIEAKSKRQLAEKEVLSSEERIVQLKEAIEKAQIDTQRLAELNEKFEKLLGSTFSGSYGSDKEDLLEFEVAQLTQLKQRINLTNYKWSNSLTLMFHACSQLAYCAKRWQQIQDTPKEKKNARYEMLMQVRNHLVAALQNIKRTGEYLDTKLPYWEDLDTSFLERSIASVFNDSRNPEDFARVFDNYKYYHWKAVLVYRWMEEKISTTLKEDQTTVESALQAKSLELQEERTLLIKKILSVEEEQDEAEDRNEENSDAVSGSSSEDGKDSNSLKNDDMSVMKPTESDHKEPEEGDDDIPPPAQSEYDPLEVAEEAEEIEAGANPDDGEGSSDIPRAKRVPLSQLAPPPSSEALFEDLKMLKETQASFLQDFEDAQRSNKDKMEDKLQEVLAKRRERCCAMVQSKPDVEDPTTEDETQQGKDNSAAQQTEDDKQVDVKEEEDGKDEEAAEAEAAPPANNSEENSAGC